MEQRGEEVDEDTDTIRVDHHNQGDHHNSHLRMSRFPSVIEDLKNMDLF